MKIAREPKVPRANKLIREEASGIFSLASLKLLAWIKTAESRAESPASAIANFMLWVPGARFKACAVKTSVKPSYSMSKNGPPSLRSLLLQNSGLLAPVPNGLPPLTVLIATGMSVSIPE